MLNEKKEKLLLSSKFRSVKISEKNISPKPGNRARRTFSKIKATRLTSSVARETRDQPLVEQVAVRPEEDVLFPAGCAMEETTVRAHSDRRRARTRRASSVHLSEKEEEGSRTQSSEEAGSDRRRRWLSVMPFRERKSPNRLA